MRKQADFWEQVQADCHTIAPEIGAATGMAYGFGAEEITQSPMAGAAVERIIGDFVKDNWPDVCDLPSNIAASVAVDSQPSIGGSGPDQSIDID